MNDPMPSTGQQRGASRPAEWPAGRLLELISYTDPYCTWCWGSEPILRRIAETYGDQVGIRFVMGGLVRDIEQFYDASNEIGGPGWQQQVAAHWREASERHGMPVDVSVWTGLGEHWSTYPACIAVKAAQLQDGELADRYLRRLREGAAAEALRIDLLDVQAELASEVGLDAERLKRDVDAGSARQAFDADLRECMTRGVRGFPTFLLRNIEGQERMLRGYQPFDTFAVAFEWLAGPDLEAHYAIADDESIAIFVSKYRKVARPEVSEVFRLSEDAASRALARLISGGRVAEQPVGNGTFYAPVG